MTPFDILVVILLGIIAILALIFASYMAGYFRGRLTYKDPYVGGYVEWEDFKKLRRMK